MSAHPVSMLIQGRFSDAGLHTTSITRVLPSACSISSSHRAFGPQLRFQIVFEEDQWVAVEQVTGTFGEGDSPDAAVDDLRQSLSQLRSELRAHADDLSPRLLYQLAALEGAFGAE